MKYAMLIYSKEVPQDQVSPEEWGQVMAEYNAYTAMLKSNGVNDDGGEALHDTNTAKSVRIRNGQTRITDGPFAETQEALGGFYILDCKDMDQAISYAAKCPGAKSGTIEIRPVVDFSSAQG